jgi:hypothetical protein
VTIIYAKFHMLMAIIVINPKMKLKWIQDHWSPEECSQAERWMEEAVRIPGLIGMVITELCLDVGLLLSQVCRQYKSPTYFTCDLSQCSRSSTGMQFGPFIWFKYCVTLIAFGHWPVITTIYFGIRYTLDPNDTSAWPIIISTDSNLA